MPMPYLQQSLLLLLGFFDVAHTIKIQLRQDYGCDLIVSQRRLTD